MKKKKLHKELMKAQEEIAVQISVINAHNERMNSQERRIADLCFTVDEMSKTMVLITDAIKKHSEQIQNLAKHLNEPRSAFRLDLSADIRRVLVSDMNNPETTLGGVLRSVIRGVVNVEDADETIDRQSGEIEQQVEEG